MDNMENAARAPERADDTQLDGKKATASPRATNSAIPDKVCRTCGEQKLIDEFWRDRSQPDGHDPHCKSCRTEMRNKPVERKPAYYAYNTAALADEVPFLRTYGRRSLNRSPEMIVSVPASERAALAAFCERIGMDTAALYELPRMNADEDRVGVLVKGIRLDQVLRKD